MIDREKVIKGLEHCRQYGTLCGKDCSGIYSYTDNFEDIVKSSEHRHDCPYGKCKTGCVVTLVDDAIILLKEQKKPDPPRCESCRHWEPETGEEGAGDYGHCRYRFGTCKGEMTGARWYCGDWEG